VSRSYKRASRSYVSGIYAGYPAAPATYLMGLAVGALTPTDRKIISFLHLRPGWDYGAGGPIPREIVDAALAWNHFLQALGFVDTEAFPGTDNEIVVGAGYGDHYFEVIVEPDLTVSIGYDFKNKQVFYKPKMVLLDAAKFMGALMGRGERWTSFGYFTPTSTVKSENDLAALLSATLQPMESYPSLASIVSPQQVPAFVTTSADFTEKSPESWPNPPFFGASHPIYFRKHIE